MFSFLIILISCWVVAASLMTEKTNAGVAVFVADTTSVCGLKSDGAAALLSACSLVRCCTHQFDFPVLRCCFRGLLHFVRSAARTSQDIVSMSTAFTDFSDADIFISQVRAAGGSPQCQLTVEDVFWNATIHDPADMTKPS